LLATQQGLAAFHGMALRVTAEELREILAVARKLRACARDDDDEDYVDLFDRAAMALEDRARQLAFHPFDPNPPKLEDDFLRAALHRPVDIIC
jgi:hypothetical protein